MPHTPTFRLNNGIEMPAIGFGVYDVKPEEAAGCVATALTSGYDMIDTAAAYGNEKEVGEGLRRSGRARDDYFITTKLWLDHYGYDGAMRGLDGSLQRLSLDYVDLYLLHWPIQADIGPTIEAWRALEAMMADGRIRAIGISNQKPEILSRFLAETDTVPAVNQIEIHPYFNQKASREANAAAGILTEAWSPIGGATAYGKDNPERPESPLQNAVITGIAEKYGKTAANVILRWHHQNGVAAIPRSVHPERIKANIQIFDFTLTDEDMAAIDALNTDHRSGPDPMEVKADTFDIHVED